MAAGTALLCSTLLCVHVFVSADQKNITAESGQNVNLTCRAPNNKIIMGVQWSSGDHGYGIVYGDEQFEPDGVQWSSGDHGYGILYGDEHLSFKNWVDRQIRDEHMFLILNNVTINDAGTYECHVLMTETRTWELISIINLRVLPPPDQKIITAESGQNVTLTCRAPNNNITVVTWSRADLGDEYVLLYQDNNFTSANQHPSFYNRVDLQDRQMQDGDVSLILKHVMINDTGTYECRVAQNSNESMELMSRTSLIVADKIIRAEPGQDVTLTCRAPNNNFIVLNWSRADLEPDHVFLYQDGHFGPNNQSFKNRVDLQDRQMKDGDVSLILKNVTINDTGRYKCSVFMREAYFMETISIIYLTVVDPPGQTGRFMALIVAVLVLLLFVGVVFLIYRKHKVSRYSYEVPTENNEAPQSPQQDCVRGQTEVNYPEPPADGR